MIDDDGRQGLKPKPGTLVVVGSRRTTVSIPCTRLAVVQWRFTVLLEAGRRPKMWPTAGFSSIALLPVANLPRRKKGRRPCGKACTKAIDSQIAEEPSTKDDFEL